MANNGLSPYVHGNLAEAIERGSTFFESVRREVYTLIHYGKYIEAQERVYKAALNARKEEKLAYIDLLKSIANSVSDDAMKERMFHDIWLLCAQM